jgi:hypothetical protein
MFNVVAGNPQKGVEVSCLLLFVWLRYSLTNYSFTDVQAYKKLLDFKEWRGTVGYLYLLGLWIFMGAVDLIQHPAIRSQTLACLTVGYGITVLLFIAEAHFRTLERLWAWRDRRGIHEKKVRH